MESHRSARSATGTERGETLPPSDPVLKPSSGGAVSSRDPFALVLLAAALGLALMRFLRLGEWSLWLDEAFTLADSNARQGLDNPVGYLLFDAFYDLVPGRPTEAWMRFPAALFGALSIGLTYWVVRPFSGARASAAAAFLMAASSWQLYWSQNARFYTTALVLGLLGGGILMRGLARESAPRTAAGILFLALAALAHPSAALLLAAFVGVPVVAGTLVGWKGPRANRAIWILAGAALVGVAAGAPWAVEVWRKWSEQKGISSPLHFVLTTGYSVTPTLGLGFLVGAVVAGRARREGFVAALVVVAGVLAAMGAALFVRVSAQYVFVFLPWICVVAAEPLRRGGLRPWLQAVWVLLLALPGLVDSALYFTVRNGDRPHWREAYLHVFERLEPDDLVLGMDAPVGEYYFDPTEEDLRHWRNVTWYDGFRADVPFEWARYPRRTWFVINREQLLDWPPQRRADALELLERECEEVARFQIPLTPRDLDVFVYLRTAPD